MRILMPPDPNTATPIANVDQPYPDVEAKLVHLLDDDYLEINTLQVL